VIVSESFKSNAAKFVVPLLAGLLPTAFFAGKSYGGDSAMIKEHETRLDGHDEDIAGIKSLASMDHDILVRAAKDVEWLRKSWEENMSKMTNGSKSVPDELDARLKRIQELLEGKSK